MKASPCPISAQRARARGFTIVELMAVVAIVGLLATLASYRYRRYVAASKTAEVSTWFASIKSAQETYRGETFAYLNVSGDFSNASFYPTNPTPGKAKVNFHGAGPGQAGWETLGVTGGAPVYFVYACVAGQSGVPTAPTDITIGNWPGALGGPWYVLEAKATLVGSNVTAFATSSFANEMYSVNNP